MAHVDRHAVEERLELLRVLAQLLAVLGEARRAATLGEGAHAALHLVALVLAEIDAAQRAHELAERDEIVGDEPRLEGSSRRCRVRGDASRAGRTRGGGGPSWSGAGRRLARRERT